MPWLDKIIIPTENTLKLINKITKQKLEKNKYLKPFKPSSSIGANSKKLL